MSEFSPTSALRAIRRVLADPRLTPALKVVAIGVVLKADNRTGEAWADGPGLMSEFHVSKDSIDRTLGRRGLAIGEHLERVRQGHRGAWCYRVQNPDEQTSGKVQNPDAAIQNPNPAVQKSAERGHSSYSLATSDGVPAHNDGQRDEDDIADVQQALEEATGQNIGAFTRPSVVAQITADVQRFGKAIVLAVIDEKRGDFTSYSYVTTVLNNRQAEQDAQDRAAQAVKPRRRTSGYQGPWEKVSKVEATHQEASRAS